MVILLLLSSSAAAGELRVSEHLSRSAQTDSFQDETARLAPTLKTHTQLVPVEVLQQLRAQSELTTHDIVSNYDDDGQSRPSSVLLQAKQPSTARRK